MTQLRLPVHSYQLRSTPASTARLVNCYAEALPEDAKTPVLLTRTPGTTAFTYVNPGPIHAMHAALGFLFVVSGSKLYKVNGTTLGATLLGDIGTPGNIDIDSNADSVVVVNEPNAYYYDGTTFGQISDADFTALGANSVEFLDNFLLFTAPDSDVFFCADLGSATAFDALKFASAEGSPDRLVGMKVDHRQVVLLGEKSIELWENIGQSGFPFARAANGFIEIGCFNGLTAVKLDNSIIWVANDYTVRRLDGATPIRVSTHAVEQFLTTVTMAAGRAFGYTQDGHLFYVLSFPEGTFVYDATTKEWHERQTYGETTWVAGCHAQAFGYEIVGNSTSNAIARLDAANYSEWFGIQRMEWTYQPVYAEGRRAFHDRLEIICETGVGITFGQGDDPEIMLDYSDDGGITWGSLPNRKLGPIGQYRQKVVWDRLGSAQQRVYRAAVSDPVRVNIADTQLTVRGGRV